MEALLVLSSVPSLIEPNQQISDKIKKVQRLIDLVLKSRVREQMLNQIILLVEGFRVAACLKEKKLEEKELAPTELSVKEHLKHAARIFRPFLYLLSMIFWGRNSKIALGVCILLDLISENTSLELYLLRFPIFDKIILRLLPGFLKTTVKSYQSYISYII